MNPLKAIRQTLGWSLSQMEAATGYDRSYIWKMENGASISDAVLDSYKQAVETQINQLNQCIGGK